MTRFAYDYQISACPEVVADILKTDDVPRLDPSRPIIFSGIGTSLHAARIAADWVTRLTSANTRALALDAHELGTDYPVRAEDQVVVISHRGYKRYPNRSLCRATEAGAETVAIVGRAAPEQQAKQVIRTCDNEKAGTFSVSYLASLAVLAKLVAKLDGDPAEGFAKSLALLPDDLAKTLEASLPKETITCFSEWQPMLIVGFGADFVTAQEAALKIKEGAWMWTEAMSPEFALHGTPASFTSQMSAILITPSSDDGGRMAELKDALAGIGLPLIASAGEREQDHFRFMAPHPLLRPFTGILPFHRITAELARIRKTDPDTLHGHREPWKSIMTSLKL